MELHLKIIGYISLVLALIHVIFPRYFKWDKELQTVSLINKQLMYVHTFFVAITVFLFGVFCIWNSKDLIVTPLGKQATLGLGIFWGLRLIFQFFVYSSKLWKGKLLETTVHVVFSILWTYFTAVFFMIYMG
jgi:hypothetical protein